MNEHSFVRSIHRYLPPEVFSWKIHDTYTGGVPDAMYCGPAGLLFVEYKYVKTLPKKDDTLIRHSLSELQIQWLERVSGPATAALVIGVENTAVILMRDFAQNISRMHYLEQNITRQDVAEWIYSTTHSGRTNERRPPSSGKKLAKDMGPEKN